MVKPTVFFGFAVALLLGCSDPAPRSSGGSTSSVSPPVTADGPSQRGPGTTQGAVQPYWDSNADFEGKLSGDQYPQAADAYKAAFPAR